MNRTVITEKKEETHGFNTKHHKKVYIHIHLVLRITINITAVRMSIVGPKIAMRMPPTTTLYRMRFVAKG